MMNTIGIYDLLQFSSQVIFENFFLETFVFQRVKNNGAI